MDTKTFLYIIYFTSVFILVITAVIYSLFIIPLLWRLSKVKNGLAILRKQLLAKGVLAGIAIFFAIFALTARYIISDVETLRVIITFTVLVFSLTFLGKAIIDLKIFRHSFSTKGIEENKKFATKNKSVIDKSEKK